MARRISTGTVGDPLLGVMKVSDDTITPVKAETNIILTPTGGATQGHIQATADIDVQDNQSINFKEASANGNNYVAVNSPATLSGNVNFTLPPDNGTNGYILQTDGNGVCTWVDTNFELVNDTATNSAINVLFTSQTSAANITEVRMHSSVFTYQPNNGTLTASNLTATSTVSGASGSFSGNMSAATITETSSIALKENISPIENALDKIMQLSGVIYDRKDGSTKSEAGLIAEEVDKVLPNLVKKDVNGNPESIFYTKLGAYLIEAIKELKDEISNLKG